MRDQVLEGVRSLVPALAQDAADVALNGAVDGAVLAKLDRIGFFKLLRPERYGGLEADPKYHFQGVRMLSRGCLSTGWLASLFGAHEWHLALFDDKAQAEVHAGGTSTFISSSYTPDGQLTPVPGGYRLSGRWRTSAGIHHASWAFLGSLLLDEEGEPVDFVNALVPNTDFSIEETWDPTGLRGVEADGVVVRNAFLPAHRTFGSRGRSWQQAPESSATLAPLYRMPYPTIHTHGVAVPLIGAAEGAYDALVAERPEAADLPAVVRALGDVRASWLQLHRNVASLIEHARIGAAPDTTLVIRSRRDQVLAAERSVRAISTFLDAAGAQALRRGHPLQRAWSDAQVALTNAANNVEDVLSVYGRWSYGLDIGDRWW